MASLFLSDVEIQNIVKKNSMEEMKNEIDTELIIVNNEEQNINETQLVEISGNPFFAKMLIVRDPSRVKLSTTYP